MKMEKKKRKKVKKLKNTSCQRTVTDGNSLGSGCCQIDAPSDEEMITDDETVNPDEESRKFFINDKHLSTKISFSLNTSFIISNVFIYFIIINN